MSNVTLPVGVQTDIDETFCYDQERIDGDALKDQYEYWGCMGSRCPQCPALVDGKKPSERYGVLFCSDAMRLDLLRRQRELDGRDA